VLKIGKINKNAKIYDLDDGEQVIGIRALIDRDPNSINHGQFYNLQFKIASLI
jgi:hypothetical protein